MSNENVAQDIILDCGVYLDYFGVSELTKSSGHTITLCWTGW
jgi:hypothetical protein